MRVIVNQLVALGRKTGVGFYAAELMRCLRAQAGTDEIVSYPPPWLEGGYARLASVWDRLQGRKARRHAAPPHDTLPALARRGGTRFVRRLARHCKSWHFRFHCWRQPCDVYFEPNYIPFPTELPTVVTVHDLSALLHPEWHPADRVDYFEEHFSQVLNSRARFVTVSDAVRQEMIDILGVPPARITRVYNGIRPEFRPLGDEQVLPVLQRLGLPRQYLLYLGTIEPRKNLLTLLKSYQLLPNAVRERCALVLVGGWGWKAGEVADYYQTHARQCGVIHLGYVASTDLPALYNGARALVYPSHYEGFGLPPVEMMACGGAVLASTAAALVEVTAGHSHLIDAEDGDGWRAAMQRVILDDEWLRKLRQGVVEHARCFTWEECARGTWRVLRGVRQRTDTIFRPDRNAA
ncbi:MAG: glycosyltransferase family 4 protein [Gemmataceae bacterium]